MKKLLFIITICIITSCCDNEINVPTAELEVYTLDHGVAHIFVDGKLFSVFNTEEITPIEPHSDQPEFFKSYQIPIGAEVKIKTEDYNRIYVNFDLKTTLYKNEPAIFTMPENTVRLRLSYE